MVSLTKEEITYYLDLYALTYAAAIERKDLTIKQIFENGLGHNYEQYIIMIRVYNFVMEMRKFSYFEDLNLEFLKEENLDLSGIQSSIFYDSADSTRFSKKQIITNIRNIINHADGVDTVCNISKNGRFMELYSKNSRPIPFHVRLNLEQLQTISAETMNNGGNLLMSKIDYDNYDINRTRDYENLDNIKFVHYYFNNTIPKDVKDRLFEVPKSIDDSASDLFQKVENVLDLEPDVNYRKVVYPLLEEQKTMIFNQLKKMPIDAALEENVNITKQVVEEVVNNTMPIPLARVHQIYYEEYIASVFSCFYGKSYCKMQSIIKNLCDDRITQGKKIVVVDPITKEKDNDMSEALSQFRDYFRSNPVRVIYMHKNESIRQLYPLTFFLSYVASNFLKDEFIVIGPKKYESRHIRNSLVHGRWFISDRYTIELYDAPKRNDMDYTFNWHESINIFELKEALSRLVNNEIVKDPSSRMRIRKDFTFEI